jgi:hypothetical protein
MIVEMGAGLGSGVRNRLIVGASTTNRYRGLDIQFLRWALEHIFEKVYYIDDPALAADGGVCITNLRINRPYRVFWPSLHGVAPYLADGVVRQYADHIKLAAGIEARTGRPQWPPSVVLIRRKTRTFADEEYLATGY